MSDPVAEALSSVEVDDEAEPSLPGEAADGEVSEAIGDLADEGDRLDPENGDELEHTQDDGGFSLSSWMRRRPEGTHRNFDRSDWWDAEQGGENRIAFHVSDAFGMDGAGPYPNAIGLLVGVAELYYRVATGMIDAPTLGPTGGDDGDDHADAPGGEGMY